VTPSRFLDAPTPLAFAHRGFAPDGAENSMAAFQRAVDLGFRYLETDVRVTADGVALAFHDSRLDRVTDAHGRVEALPWYKVREARISGVEPIPLLTDVLDAWPDVCVNLDVKSDSGIDPAIDAIRRTGAGPRVCIAAFSGRRLAVLRGRLGPEVCSGLGPAEVVSLRASRGAAAARLRGRCAQVPARVGRWAFVERGYLDAAHARGVQVHAWTVNDRAEMTRLLDLAVDGIMTDRADVLREVLQARGAWAP
jgi:glycerophosphoryl diester phosphodiesterase